MFFVRQNFISGVPFHNWNFNILKSSKSHRNNSADCCLEAICCNDCIMDRITTLHYFELVKKNYFYDVILLTILHFL